MSAKKYSRTGDVVALVDKRAPTMPSGAVAMLTGSPAKRFFRTTTKSHQEQID
jgi:hypothetical protein